MDIDALAKKIENLEIQLSSIKKAVSGQNSKINQVDERVVGFLDKAREHNNELSKINSILTGIGHYDAEITKLRVDLNRQIDEAEKRILLNQKIQEKIKTDEIKSLNLLIEKSNKEVVHNFEQKLKLQNEEYVKVFSKINEVDSKIDTKVSNDEDLKVNINLLMQEIQQNKKQFDSVSNEMEGLKRRIDELRSKFEVINRDLKIFDNRLNEIIATETERKQSYLTFIDQQTLMIKDREQTWSDWTTQFDESINQIYKLLPELQNQQNEMKKTKMSLDVISEKFERRANEITEMYRLMDDKFRKEWATYKSDLEKRWSNMGLILDDKQEGSEEKFQKLNERIISVEDGTQEMQEAFLLMSREIQKGMQSLMNMVNGWMDAFNQIKSQK